MFRTIAFFLWCCILIVGFSFLTYALLTNFFGVRVYWMLGVGFMPALVGAPVAEEIGRLLAANLARATSRLGMFAAGATFGIVERTILSQVAPSHRLRDYPDEIWLLVPVVLFPVALHAVNSVVCIRAISASKTSMAAMWFSSAVVLHVLNNNQYAVAGLLGSDAPVLLLAMQWVIVVILGVAAFRPNAVRSTGRQHHETGPK